MPRPALLLVLVATAASARTPAPPPERVSDRDLLRVLSTQYGARARLHGDWASRTEAGATRSICADSGDTRGPRYVAVCGTEAMAPARVDLLVIEPATSPRGRPHIRARFRGIERDDAPTAGDVHLMPIAPDRLAFVLDGSATEAGWTRASQSLYAEGDGGLRRLLAVGTRLDNLGACTPGDERAGRRCREHAVSLTCTLRADATRVDAAAWPLVLAVSGQRAGEAVHRTVEIPHDAYGYRVSSRVLETQACDGRD